MKPVRCRQAARLMQLECDRKLKVGEKTALMLHLAVCVHCRRYRRQLEMLNRSLKDYSASLENFEE